jgi:hypothetical protein
VDEFREIIVEIRRKLRKLFLGKPPPLVATCSCHMLYQISEFDSTLLTTVMENLDHTYQGEEDSMSLVVLDRLAHDRLFQPLALGTLRDHVSNQQVATCRMPT